MKTLKYIIALGCILTYGTSVNAQTHDHSKMDGTKTEQLKVSGNCGMCKSRIEKAALLDGVSKAEWNKETKVLTLVYNPSKVSSDDIQKNIAAAGHDTDKFKASDSIYNSLPGCCKYR